MQRIIKTTVHCRHRLSRQAGLLFKPVEHELHGELLFDGFANKGQIQIMHLHLELNVLAAVKIPQAQGLFRL